MASSTIMCIDLDAFFGHVLSITRVLAGDGGIVTAIVVVIKATAVKANHIVW